ncbi:hypothetical protein [Erysipelothrix tonsillarum]|uniref:hypothetical protein n=1 Tax=Erysipelothrix tonsillarum TaxID=38402 RepID=UPI0039C82FCB
MAIKIGKPSKGVGGEAPGQPGPERGSSKDTHADTATTGDIRVIGGDTTSTGAEKAVVSGLPSVEGNIPTPGKPKKPRKRTTSTSKKAETELTADMLASLIGVIFNLIAVRAGDHWKMNEKEAYALAEPITRILARHDLVGKAGEYGDYIALTVAIGGIIGPKVMYDMATKPKKKENIKHVEPIREQRGQSRNQEPEPQRETAASGGTPGERDGAAAGTSQVYDSRAHFSGIVSAF